MKLTFNKKNRLIYQDVINEINFNKEIDSSNYKIDGNIYTAPNEILGITQIKEMFANGVEIEGYSVWLEVLNVNLGNLLPNTLSFSGATSGMTYGDLYVSATGSGSTILHFDQYTGIINKEDFNVFYNDPNVVQLHSISSLQLRQSYEDFYQPVSGETYQPYTFMDYEKFDTDWQTYFYDWYDAQNYIQGMWNELGGDRYYPLKWRILDPVDDAEAEIAYGDYPNFPYKTVII